MLEMQQAPISNATMRFRFQSLQQSWVLFTTYWNRTIQEIEAGTYRRDLERGAPPHGRRGGSDHRAGGPGAGHPGQPGQGLRRAADPGARRAARRRRRPRPSRPAARARRAPAAAPPARPPAPRLGAEQLAAFYRKYAEAHQRAVGAPPKATPSSCEASCEKLLEGQSFERRRARTSRSRTARSAYGPSRCASRRRRRRPCRGP